MKSFLYAAAAFAAATVAHANSFTNGDFSSNTGNGQVSYNTTVTGWYIPAGGAGYTFLFQNGTADTTGASGVYGGLSLWGSKNGGLDTIGAPPSGSNWLIAQDGDFQGSPLSQDITGLTVGKTYTVGFDYGYAQQAGFYGDTIQSWSVSLGVSPAQTTPAMTNPSQGFTGWFHDAFSFVATNPSETLSFVANGNLPVPPFAVLSGVTFTPDGVPEPAGWALMILGVGGLGCAVRRRRALAIA